jgi:bacteriocin biosynthesis cyclodehydratase domain-containing protein
MAMLILTEGRFGVAVADILKSQVDATVRRLTDALCGRRAEFLDRAMFVAVALWRPYHEECDALDTACWRAGVPWSSAYLTEDKLVSGPLTIPRHGPCYGCFRKRYLTHCRAPERELALFRAYANDPDLGPEGFVPAMAAIAASGLLSDARAPRTAAGRLRRVDLFTGAMIESAVVGVHQCERCGHQSKAQPGERFVRELVPAVQGLLQ